MLLTLSEITNQINTNPAPLLLVDTCTFLDVIRVPYRENIQINMIDTTMTLISRAKLNPPSLWLVSCDIVKAEWESNANEVCNELKMHISKYQQSGVRLGKILEKALPGITYYQPDLVTFSLEQHLYNLSKNLLEASLKIADDDDCLVRATKRVRMNQAPASKSKSEPKDCMIIEHYLALCQGLRNSGFSKKCIFVSSNVNDYGKPHNIHQPLDTQFNNLGIDFVTDLSWAMSMI
jgi:hypothetical protein